MEKNLSPVSSQDRIAHLNLLANGEEVLKVNHNKYLLIGLASLSILVIIILIIYYESQLNSKVEGLKHSAEIHQDSNHFKAK